MKNLNSKRKILNSTFTSVLYNYARLHVDCTKISVFNTLTKQKEPLKLRNENTLYWYTCGPTVYSSAHIGHAR